MTDLVFGNVIVSGENFCVCVNSNGRKSGGKSIKNRKGHTKCDIMSASEPESCLQIYGERRMAITIAAIAAESSEATNRDIILRNSTVADIKKGR